MTNPPQHEVALAHAQEVRIARSVIRRELRAAQGKEAALELCAQHVAEPVVELATMPLVSLIATGHRCGDPDALAIVGEARVSANVCIGQIGEDRPGWLTDAQRERVCAALLEHADAVRYNRRQRKLHRPRPKIVAVPEPQPEPELRIVPEPEEQGPSLARWCPVCAQWAIPMHNGTCGFCDTQIEEAA
jgi:hypothetical protein